jgi:cell division protein FtsN
MNTQGKTFSGNAQAAAPSRKRRSLTVTVSPATVISSLITLCVGMLLVFCLGIFLGRGYDLESRLPGLERILPESAPLSPPLIVDENSPAPLAADGGAENRGAGGQAPFANAASPNAASPNIANEDRATGKRGLDPAAQDARDSLKSPAGQQSAREKAPAPPDGGGEKAKTADRAEAAKSAPAGPSAPSGPSGQSRRPGQGQSVPAKTPEKTAQGQSAQAKAAEKTTAPGASAQTPPRDTRAYKYVYQAAAYKDQPSCDRFTAKLKSAGFGARTEKLVDGNGVIWFRVMIDFTGTPEATDSLREKLQEHGVPRVLLRSKTPAG